MNIRSLRFQVVAWFAALLSGSFVLLGAATYFGLRGYLEGTLVDRQSRRVRVLGQALLRELHRGDEARVADRLEAKFAKFAPGQFNRLLRITRSDGQLIYLSGPPQNGTFVPTNLPARTPWPSLSESFHKVKLPRGREMMVTAHVVQGPRGTRYLIETGEMMDSVKTVLSHCLRILMVGLPLSALIAVLGGYALVTRALMPVARITASAEQITSRNLSDRLPVAPTGDELESLALALNRMIERLDKAFHYTRRFVADASHELRTPLTVLQGELEGFVQEPRLTVEQRVRLGSALEEVERLTHMVEGLLALSRLDAREVQTEWMRLDLAQLAASTAEQMALLAEDKNIRLNCTVRPGVWVEGDRGRLRQVVVNLLDNAFRYTPPGGAVTLSAQNLGGHAVLEVADTGIGIPATALPHIFERFFRVDQSRSRELGGVGLGLSIVKSICTSHHGTVEVDSTPDHGSRFRVKLPRSAPPADAIQTKHERRTGTGP